MKNDKITVNAELTPAMLELIQPIFEHEIHQGQQWPMRDGRTGMKFVVTGKQADTFRELMRNYISHPQVRVNFLGLEINPN